ncbi:glutarate-semialdehyde dehydrogenase-like [Drosophila guanche]|uniref:Blast:Glutarate-semialdehyde dehydrogenase DavD n=1 Tax=Drosophila guanche TaxID=7266 RepID=A0A3B0KCX4_DROGU|nr:glutarate-semialdehyde dehydrogenase-like [Drosophila guanche]SPP83566.1 blast:Glutarate-semialdehyde dehydrogenase DavD [Drosophila guanche]
MWRHLNTITTRTSSFSRMRSLSALVQSKALVNGNWIEASGSATFEVRNPSSGEVIGHVPNMNVSDAQDAINAAKQAYESKEWRSLTAKDRSPRNTAASIQAVSAAMRTMAASGTGATRSVTD